MIKKVLYSIVFLTASLFAAVIDPAYVSKYEVTITKLELKKDDGSYLTIFSDSKPINIASASAGESAGSLVEGQAIEDGVYTHVRVTTSANFVINACDGGLTTGNCTNGTSIGGGSASAVVTNGPSDTTLTVGVQQVESPLSFNVTNGVCSLSGGMSISFNLTNAVNFDLNGSGPCTGADCIYIATPSVSIAKN